VNAIRKQRLTSNGVNALGLCIILLFHLFTGFIFLPENGIAVKTNLREYKLFYKLHGLFIGHKAMFANEFQANK